MPGPHIIQSFVKPSMHFFVSLSYHIPHTYTAAYPTLLSSSTHGSLLSSLQLVSHLSPLPISLLLLLPPAAASSVCWSLNGLFVHYFAPHLSLPLFPLPLTLLRYLCLVPLHAIKKHRNHPFSFIVLPTRSKKNTTEGKKPRRLGCSFLTFIYPLHSLFFTLAVSTRNEEP